MKKLVIVFVLIFCSFNYAQEETLLGTGEIDHGGFGGPVVKFTSINDQFGVLVGGRGGWIINHSFVIGGGGYGLVNEVEGTQLLNERKMFLNFGYGGFEMEYIMNWEKIAHSSVYLLIGGGGVNHRDRTREMDWNWDNDETDVFFVIEPAVNFELNIVSFFRLGIGASYRFISGVDDSGLTDKDLSGPSAMLTFKFGKF